MEKIVKRFNFNEEKHALLENEIFLVLLCFEPKSDFVENIKRELSIDTNVAGWIAEDVEKNIFGKVAGEINSTWQATETMNVEVSEESKGAEEKIEEPKEQSGDVHKMMRGGVGQAFNQIILNQAKAMRPAREAPSNLPTSEQQTKGEIKAIHNYVPGSDPYREPIG